MSRYNLILSSNECTVVSKYEALKNNSSSYQSEAALEKEFIKQLGEQGYEYLEIHDGEALINNLKLQLEKLNQIKFSDNEWDRFFNECISNKNETIEDKTKKIQQEHVQLLRRDNGSSKNITLIDKNNIHNNTLQVINQYATNEGTHKNRYDVTILVNGFPLVHIELKRRGVALREAFNQINRYQRESFWAGAGLYEYVQIFVISNGTSTKYYSNSTRKNAINENGKQKKKRTSNSFEFTSYWADADNKVIYDLVDFTRTFFAKHTLLNILTKFCVFTEDKRLLVMRPYQIVAAERIINKVIISSNYKKMGTTDAGGYIWHTTGSGKTLTSFKTAQLLSNIEGIDKVLFVVDRKDLDYQTMREYDRYEKGSANSNKSTAILTRQLEDNYVNRNGRSPKIIITTIQKLDKFIKQNPKHPVMSKHIVLIFDECHRTQFGDMHRAITKNFKNYHIFGFTGTPIFAANASSSGSLDLRTTEQAFGEKLHTYTIVDAINDGNVLPFRIDYVNTVKRKKGVRDKQVEKINNDSALLARERIEKVVEYILEHFNQKTKRDEGRYEYSRLINVNDIVRNPAFNEIREKQYLKGFNSIFAVQSIEAAKLYYAEFKRQMDKTPEKRLKIATIYSFAVNEEGDDFLDDENLDDTSELDVSSRDFLENAIQDYNRYFRVDFDTSSDKFQNYYKDLSLRMKNREIDLLIVVNMFLTGFDATTLNTLWVDKNLKQHGLIQAFSRTNRILNSVKTYGQIVCFRDLQDEVDAAVGLFGDKDAAGIVLMRPYQDYYDGYTDERGRHEKGYKERVEELLENYPLGETILGESAEKDFIVSFGNILRLRNILSSFDEFRDAQILTDREFQDYTGRYNDLYDKYRSHGKGENIKDDIIFEMELVRQVEVNIDYILALIVKYHKKHCNDKEIKIQIDSAIRSSLQLRSKKDLIEDFINTINAKSDVMNDWQKFVREEQQRELYQIIEDERLKEAETVRIMADALNDGELKTIGVEFDRIMPPISRFGGGERGERKEGIIQRLKEFFDKYFGLGINSFMDQI